MPIQSKQVDRYGISIPLAPMINYTGIIFLYSDSWPSILARLYFLTGNLPSPSISQAGTITNVWLPDFQFSRIVDMLRNESPVYFAFDVNYANLHTSGSEPTGEGERI